MPEKACCENCAFWREVSHGAGHCTEQTNIEAADPAFTPVGALPMTRWYEQCGLWEDRDDV